MGDNTLELDLLLKAQLDGVDKELFDSLERSAKKTAQQINKAFNFGKVVAGIRLIQSSFSGLTNAVTKMTKLTANLVTTSVKGFASIAGAILGVTTKVSGLNSILNDIKAGFTGLASSISSAISAIDFKGLIKESIELSSGLTEVQNVIDVVFKDGAKEINAFTENAVSQLGMTTLAARQFAGKFGAALTTTGQSTDSILQMSKALTALTADIASFYDIEQDVAAAKLFSGVISGQTRPMRELGVDMTKASLAEYALSKGIQTAYKDMSAAEKQALRFNYAMEKLNFVQGDYARTINSTANQMRLLKNSLKELGSVVGTIINAFFNPLLQVLNRVVVAVTNVVKTIASAMGIDWTLGTGSAGVSGISGVANAYDDLADSAEDLADSEDEVAKATGKASKEAKKALAPFHKLNILQNKAAEDSTGKGAGSGLGTIGDLADSAASAVAQKLPSIQDMIKNFFDWLWGLDWEGWMDNVINKINEFFSDLPAKIQKFFDDLQPWIERIVNLFNQFAEGVDWYKIGESVSEVIEGIGRSIATAFGTANWDSYGKAFADFLNGLIDNAQMFTQWGTAIGEGINGAFELIANAAANLHWDTLGENLYRGLQAAFSEIDPENIYSAIYGVLSGVTTAINTFFEELIADDTTKQKIADSISAMIIAAADYLGSDSFAQLVDNIVSFLLDELGRIEEKLDDADTKEKIKEGIVTLINGVGELLSADEFNTLVEALYDIVKTAIVEFFKNKDIPIGLKIVAAKELMDITGLSDALGAVASALGSIVMFTQVANLISNIGSAAGTAATGIEDVAPAVEAVTGDILSASGEVIAFADDCGTLETSLTVLEDASETVFTAISTSAEQLNTITVISADLAAAIAAAIAIIIAAFADLYANTERFRTEINNIISGISTTFSNQIQPIQDALSRLGQAFSDVFTGLQPLIDSAIQVLSGVGEQLVAIWNILKTILEPAFVALTETVSVTIQGIIEIVSGAIQIVIGLINGFLNGDWTTFINGVQTLFTGLIDTLTAGFQGFIKMLEYLVTNFQAMWNTIWNNLKNLLIGIINELTGKFKAFEQLLKAVFIALASAIIGKWNAVKSAVTGVINAITDKIEKLKEKITGLIDKVKQLVEEWNPLKNFSLPSLGGGGGGDTPAGAHGMIIQPNKPQLAIVGDQTSGINVESPLSTMVEAFRTAAKDLTSAGFNGNITIPIYVDGVLTTQKVITASQMHNYRSNGR